MQSAPLPHEMRRGLSRARDWKQKAHEITCTEDFARRDEISDYSDEKISHVPPPGEYGGRAIDQGGKCNRSTNKPLHFPLPGKLGTPRPVVSAHRRVAG